MYHKKNVDYAYLLWEDFVYQVENKNVKRSNEMYYPRFTKVIVNFFMTKDSSIPRRNRVIWHCARDDLMFTTIKVVSRHEDTQLYGVILPDELTNEAIKDSKSYKEYYVIASGAEPPKTKESVKKKQTGSDKTKTPLTAKGKRLKTSAMAAKPSKKKQPAKTSKAKDEGTGNIPGVLDVPTYASNDEKISWKSSDEEDDDEVAMRGDDDNDADNQDDDDDDQNDDNDDDDDGQDHEEDKEEDSFDPRVQTPSHVESTNNEDNDEEIQGANVDGEELDEEETNEEDEANELYRDVNVNLEGRDNEMTNAARTIIQTTQVIEDTHVIITLVNLEGQHQSSSVSSGFISNMLNPSPDTGIDSIFNLNTESTLRVDVLVTTIVEPPLLSAIILPSPPLLSSRISNKHQFPHQQLFQAPPYKIFLTLMHEAVKIVVQLQSDRLRDEAQAENKDYINKLDDNIKKIIKDQVKEQTSHAVAANLSELELKKILINKMKINKSIHRFDEQKNLYKALVDSYKSDKLILDTYGDTVSFKRHRDDEDKDDEPSAGSNRGSKRRRARKEQESTSAPKEKTSKTTGKSTEGSKSHHKSKPAKPPTPDRDWNKTLPDAHGPVQPSAKIFGLDVRSVLVELEYFFEEVYKATTDQLDWNNPEGQQYPYDMRKPLPLIPSSWGRQVIPFIHFINNDLTYLSGGVSSRTYTTLVINTKAADYSHIKWIKDLVPNKMWSQVSVSYDEHALWGISHWGQKQQQFYGFAANRESSRDITVRRDDDKLLGFWAGLAIYCCWAEGFSWSWAGPIVSSIPGIVDLYLANKMHEAVKIVVQLQSDRLRDEAQAENEDFINKLDDNIKKIIKDQVKEQVKAQVSKILLKIKKTINEQLEADVLTRSSNESKTSHAVAANLSELELKKILIDKMENTVSLKRRRDDEDKDEEPSTGSNQGSKRRRAGKGPESTSPQKEKTSKTIDKSTEGSKSHHKSADKSGQAEEPMHTTEDLEEPAHQEFVTGDTKDKPDKETSQLPDLFQKPAKPPIPDRDWNKTLPAAHGPVQPMAKKSDSLSLVELEYFFEEVYKATTNQLDWNNPEGQQYPHDLRKPLPLISNSRGCQVIPFDHFINNDLAYLSGGVSSRTYTTSITKTKAADYGHIKWIEDLGQKRQQFYGFAANRESAHDVYSKRRIIAVTKLQIVEWHNYKHLDLITVRRDDDKMYKFKEEDFNRLRIQDIKYMLNLFVQDKLTNLTVEEHLTFNVSLRMFTRSIVIQRHVEDIQLGVESYQNKLNLTKPDTLMRIDELHKFSDGTLNDVRTALDDRLKGIRMKYLPQTIWRQSDRDKSMSYDPGN
ncbi:hypothetical protein Tco_1090090 [Tanacetum coccineum]|uniref:Uncharacterized protein n=1 Tax=Tanacetum coccineum TaxID=301880 RepID=A0ABQ5I4V3_9ASTR